MRESPPPHTTERTVKERCAATFPGEDTSRTDVGLDRVDWGVGDDVEDSVRAKEVAERDGLEVLSEATQRTR
jgi:hypothetical protein